MSRIVFGSMGTRGDVYPMLAIAAGLVRRGHRVVFATSARNRALVEAAGAEFRLLRPEAVITNDSASAYGVAPEKLGAETALRRIIFPSSENSYLDMLAAGKGCDLMVLPMFLSSAQMAAERLGIPWVVTHAAPASFNSAFDPTYIPQVRWLYPLQRMTPTVSRLFKPVAKRSVRSWWRPVRELRRREGFAPLKRCPMLDGVASPYLTLAMFSSLMGSRQKDWPQPAVITGFPFYEETDRSGGVDFAMSGDAPLVATLGSAVSVHRMNFLESTIEAARRLGKRLLLIAGPEAELLRRRFTSDALCIVPYAPYAEVFPHACALIVAGSIGPVGHGLRAGKPMLIVSEATFGPDQDDNAIRAGRLGVSRRMTSRRYTAESAEQKLRLLLDDPEYATNAAGVGERVRAEDGVARACEALEEVMAQHCETEELAHELA